jgi:hypothetical protein
VRKHQGRKRLQRAWSHTRFWNVSDLFSNGVDVYPPGNGIEGIGKPFLQKIGKESVARGSLRTSCSGRNAGSDGKSARDDGAFRCWESTVKQPFGPAVSTKTNMFWKRGRKIKGLPSIHNTTDATTTRMDHR